MTSPNEEMAYEQRYRQEREEYGTWVAVSPITYDGVVVYQPGHAVPKSNVERHGYDADGLVERVDGGKPAEENTPPEAPARAGAPATPAPAAPAESKPPQGAPIVVNADKAAPPA